MKKYITASLKFGEKYLTSKNQPLSIMIILCLVALVLMGLVKKYSDPEEVKPVVQLIKITRS